MYAETELMARQVAAKLLIRSPYTTKMEGGKQLMECADAIADLEERYRECRDELCLRCGKYVERYKGACIDCKWR